MVQLTTFHDVWHKNPNENKCTFGETKEILAFLPNGIMIPLEINTKDCLLDVKEKLFEEAQNYPLYGTLHDPASYVFVCVNPVTAKREELLDEERIIEEVKPFQAILKLVERKVDSADNVLKIQIGNLIGKSLYDFDALKNPEVNDFRWKMKILSKSVAEERERQDWLTKMLYRYPVQIDNRETPSQTFLNRTMNGNLLLSIHSPQCQRRSVCEMVLDQNITVSQGTFKFFTPHETTTNDLMNKILAKKAHVTNCKKEKSSDYVLKVLGRDEFILGNYPLSRYKYIRQMVEDLKVPKLILLPTHEIDLEKESIYESLDKLEPCRTSLYSSNTIYRKRSVWSWPIEDQFRITINKACKLYCNTETQNAKLVVYAGLFHGGDSVSDVIQTGESVAEESECKWEEELSFNIKVCDIPRMAKLCLAICEVKSKRSRPDFYRMSWVNTTVYDFKNALKYGSMTLHTWPYADEYALDGILNPLGTVAQNPYHETSTAIMVSFPRYNETATVCYPCTDYIIDYATKVSEDESENRCIPRRTKASKSHLNQLQQICDRDSLHQMLEQEKELLWLVRHDCCEQLPRSLPNLLRSVKWNDHNVVAEIVVLLEKWRPLPPEQALELLDYAYADQNVRRFAVKCLETMSDDDLSLYLLQLVQALKHESYLHNALVEFLLNRALNNRHLGHRLFWLLRSEMSNPSVAVLYGVILEAYCYGAQNHMNELAKQVASLAKLKTISENVHQETRKDPKNEVLSWMHCVLGEERFVRNFVNQLSPLDPTHRIKTIIVEECAYMDSKMKPLKLVFANTDKDAEDIMIMFKNGDDLRQDMLTLQMFRIMDKIWQDEGLNLRMIPYQCLATDQKMGLIEIVQEAKTIAKIQTERGMNATSPFKKGLLLAWLKEINNTEASLNQAIEEFTLSCAGYSVATYVLGIADRHNDNIMVKKNGQLFHIDFGHIMGNFKEKFGFRRERVPFVLPNDFIHVMTLGGTTKSEKFNQFRTYCEEAFLLLRRKGPLIISLFAMMLSTGIPELSCEKDLDYLRETLDLECNENEALLHFRTKFEEAIRNNWKTSLMWAAHILAHNQKPIDKNKKYASTVNVDAV